MAGIQGELSRPRILGLKHLCLANASLLHGKKRGYVVFGVRDSTWEIVGTKLAPAQEKVEKQELENWLHIRMRPKIDFRLHEFCYDDKKIAIVEIEPARDRPVTFENVAYIRIGSYNKRLSDHPDNKTALVQVCATIVDGPVGCAHELVLRLCPDNVVF